MPTIKAIFVSPDGFIHEAVGDVVRSVTKSKYAHAALALPLYGTEYIVEAIAPCVCLSPGDKYKDEEILRVVEIPVTAKQLRAIQQEVLRLVAKKPAYGLLTDCLAGGIADVFGNEAGEAVAKVICSEKSMDCSRLQAYLIRMAHPEYGGDMSEHIITPGDGLYACCSLLGLPQEECYVEGSWLPSLATEMI